MEIIEEEMINEPEEEPNMETKSCVGPIARGLRIISEVDVDIKEKKVTELVSEEEVQKAMEAELPEQIDLEQQHDSGIDAVLLDDEQMPQDSQQSRLL